MDSPNRPLRLEDIEKNKIEPGNNPFKEDTPTGKDADPNAPADYRGAYEPTRGPMGMTLFWISCVGFVGSLGPTFVIAFPDFEMNGMFATLGCLVSWVVSPVTLVYAVSENNGIRLGAVPSDRKLATQATVWISAMAILTSISLLTLIFYV